jgi:hypothetical protein
MRNSGSPKRKRAAETAQKIQSLVWVEYRLLNLSRVSNRYEI